MTDSLADECKINMLHCKKVIWTKKKITDRDATEDQYFLHRLKEALEDSERINKTRKMVSPEKFVARKRIYRNKDTKILEIFFATNYISGVAAFLYEKNRLITNGCRMKTSYSLYCGDSTGSFVSMLDFMFFNKYVLPVFKNTPIKEYCDCLVLGNIDEIEKKSGNFNHLFIVIFRTLTSYNINF